MSHFATHPGRATAADHRAQVMAEAVVSAYIDEIARPGRGQRRPRTPSVARGGGHQTPSISSRSAATCAPSALRPRELREIQVVRRPWWTPLRRFT